MDFSYILFLFNFNFLTLFSVSLIREGMFSN